MCACDGGGHRVSVTHTQCVHVMEEGTVSLCNSHTVCACDGGGHRVSVTHTQCVHVMEVGTVSL